MAAALWSSHLKACDYMMKKYPNLFWSKFSYRQLLLSIFTYYQNVFLVRLVHTSLIGSRWLDLGTVLSFHGLTFKTILLELQFGYK